MSWGSGGAGCGLAEAAVDGAVRGEDVVDVPDFHYEDMGEMGGNSGHEGAHVGVLGGSGSGHH